MTIKKNSRQMPKTVDITAQKDYSDILYGYLQVNSIRDEETGERYVPKALARKTMIAEALGVTRQTITTRFNKLVSLGLVENSSRGPVLVDLAAKQAFLIPQDTLRKLVNTLSNNSITVYVYLLNRFIANSEHSYEFTISALKA